MKTLYRLFLAANVCAGAAWCGMVVLADAPGVQTTQVENAGTYDFNDLTTGYHSNVFVDFGNGISGTYDRLLINPADTFGGADGSVYPDASVQIGRDIPSYSLTLSQQVNYFGMWWSAGDPANVLKFYNGNTLVASYTTAAAMSVLDPTNYSEYYGNPNPPPGRDRAEPFAYLNFFGTDGTTFDRIVFSVTDAYHGFESDNHAVAYPAEPGDGTDVTGVPEPTTVLLMLGGLAGIFVRRKMMA